MIKVERTYVPIKSGIVYPDVNRFLYHPGYKGITLLPGECLCSDDVTALFTSVPIDPALTIIKDLLEQDDALWDRTVLSV